ncbi:MAG: hypothetical protein F6J93_29750 [Oscillatoria sp. SIO1A7]|nr:hypothetical protein [Oscillatoria sp. SIO1A7]
MKAKVISGMLSPLRFISRVDRGQTTSNLKNIPLKGVGRGERTILFNSSHTSHTSHTPHTPAF